MRNKYLTFKKCDDGHYVVMAGKQALGCIEPRGQLFTKRAIFQETVFDGAEWTSECLQQLAEKLDSLEGVVSPSASDNKSSLQFPDISEVDKHVLFKKRTLSCDDKVTLDIVYDFMVENCKP